ncbi:hypothetical protein [Spongiactinospora sp. TRM90649]|uniref:hypothetical protein n=1 Tax=Spongiactinospora sp. TRM90649 TaxID=3031114 RepID=UPI0023F8E0A2|nr:hypothetical protein [Spongiactinospora sp. TRM90649]MDF5758623.1 hypothetical protein [Spongiactinospora sp. TRM90649]
MAWIPCTTGTAALYKGLDGAMVAVVVEAWDDAGVPYVAGDAGLEDARSRPGFVRLARAVAIVPPPALPPVVVHPPRPSRPVRPGPDGPGRPDPGEPPPRGER